MWNCCTAKCLTWSLLSLIENICLWLAGCGAISAKIKTIYLKMITLWFNTFYILSIFGKLFYNNSIIKTNVRVYIAINQKTLLNSPKYILYNIINQTIWFITTFQTKIFKRIDFKCFMELFNVYVLNEYHILCILR